MQILPSRPGPAQPPVPGGVGGASPSLPANSADRVTLQALPFEPELSPRSLFQGQVAEPAPEVVYYDRDADAADRARYYGDLPARAGSMGGKELYDHLSRLVSRTHQPLDYSPSQNLYPWVDRRPGLHLESIYSDNGEIYKARAEDPGGLWILMDGEGPSDMVYSERTSKVYNCEHVVPQSWFQKRGPMKGDLHHLFTCEIDCNSLRGNSVYHDFVNSGDSFASCGITDGERRRFEPAAGKGAVARAVLYFLLRYPGMIGDEAGEYTEKDLELLKSWSREEPVGEYELHRNRAIEQKQGNRNPLIDFPELVERIDFRQGLGRRR